MALEIEIDGKKLTVPDGSTVMEAAKSAGTYIPHFCYHKKLSIAANCRMCLVEVEKAPKPLPACATPVTDGMKVFTHSDLALKAQKGVMEFLLINHPLDCPICDQGGECQLQDLAVGYGNTRSRYQEDKRSVVGKEMGPLVSAEEMSRCIHCTRCVRFTEEIGGFQEIGMANRGELSEILPFLGKTVDSEISGNVIDLCPVGALTSKPFRYSARPWELSRRKSVAPHDGLGSNLVVQVKNHRVLRVLPLENEQLNECWLSDRDRFSYEGLNSENRLTRPMVKQDGKWIETDWAAALDYVSHALKDVQGREGAEQIGFVGSPHATLEELFLFKRLASALGVRHVDARTRRSDFRADGKQGGALWLGRTVASLSDLSAALVVGSQLRKEQPLVASRLRQAVKKGLKLSVVGLADDDLRCAVSSKSIVKPSGLVPALARVLRAVAEARDASPSIDVRAVEVDDAARRMATDLIAAEGNAAIMLGAQAEQHPRFAELLVLANDIARLTGATAGVLSAAANSVGAELVCRPEAGCDMQAMLAAPRAAYVLLNVEPDADLALAEAARVALAQAKTVAALTAFKTPALLEMADVLLPVAPFTETAGAFVNMEGRLQSFNGVVKPLGDTRPAWKVLRVLGNLVGAAGFDYETVEAVRAECLGNGDIAGLLDNGLTGLSVSVAATPVAGLERLAEVPLYALDPLVRQAPSLQATRDAREAGVARVHPDTLAALDLPEGAAVAVVNGRDVPVTLAACRAVPEGVVRLAVSAAAGLSSDSIELKRG
ncbi:NADH-quinone oxidoreductase subunit NuoG [Laribacter hongkongensis]|uniref:NADH-quinone oxidoreductase subunit NuoG n=1 Tax=Laribacter hongkongensis TaxID=168471 RepID=UPI001EFD5FA5|nr:NADH-quinone oxidoreductase subunit NuoG [Laribacter hongkongensis]MCG9066217.1 NADH-quinone oxidoreductase subunit NuoG [Laribacter hongkongensis]